MADQEIVLDAEEQALQREARLAGYRKTIAEGATATMPDLSVDVPDRSLDVGDGESQLPGLIAQDVADELADGVVQPRAHQARGTGPACNLSDNREQSRHASPLDTCRPNHPSSPVRMRQRKHRSIRGHPGAANKIHWPPDGSRDRASERDRTFCR